MAGVTSSTDIYKVFQPSQIIKSDDKVILDNFYIIPFSVTLEKTKLFNLTL